MSIKIDENVIHQMMHALEVLEGRVRGFSRGNPYVKVSTANTANPPTAAQLVSAFGAAATVGAGFVGIVNDNNADANDYLVFSNGTSYWILTATKAV